VPDVAFLSYERLGYDEDEAAQIPYMAPDAAIEILSPDDGRADIEEKIRVYLASGTALVRGRRGLRTSRACEVLDRCSIGVRKDEAATALGRESGDRSRSE